MKSAGLVVTLLLAAGCSENEPPRSIATAHFRGFLPGAVGLGKPSAAFVPSAKVLGLTTLGSSTCPQTPVQLTAESPTRVTVQLRTYMGNCTSDGGAPTSFLLTVPDSVTGPVVQVTLDYGESSDVITSRVLSAVPTGPQATTG